MSRTNSTRTYRSDSSEGLPADIQAYTDAHFLRKLANVQQLNPKLLVVFSGGNALGKSTISARIQEELHGLVLENDAIKQVIREYAGDIPREELNRYTWQYGMGLYERLSAITQNGLVVRDGVIDWYYDRVLPLFEKQGYALFIIAFDVSAEKRKQLILERGDTPTAQAARLVELMPEHDQHTRIFRQHFTPDITLTDGNLFDHDLVINEIALRLAQLKAHAANRANHGDQ